MLFPCYTGFYASQSEEACKAEIPVGLPCSTKDVCAKNAQCSAAVGGGVCECREEFYKVKFELDWIKTIGYRGGNDYKQGKQNQKQNMFVSHMFSAVLLTKESANPDFIIMNY